MNVSSKVLFEAMKRGAIKNPPSDIPARPSGEAARLGKTLKGAATSSGAQQAVAPKPSTPSKKRKLGKTAPIEEASRPTSKKSKKPIAPLAPELAREEALSSSSTEEEPIAARVCPREADVDQTAGPAEPIPRDPPSGTPPEQRAKVEEDDVEGGADLLQLEGDAPSPIAHEEVPRQSSLFSK